MDLASPEQLREYGQLGAAALIGLICIVGLFLSTKQFTRLMDRHHLERVEWKVSMEKLFDTADKSSRASTRAVNELHDSLEKNTNALEKVQCIKRFN